MLFRFAIWHLGLTGGAKAISNRPALGGVYHKIRRLRNVVLGKIALLQRHPPGGKIGISLPLPRLQAREGERYANFAARWVPLEEGYFAQYHIAETADFVVDTTQSGTI